MSNQPFVSVVIPVFNGEDTIEELLSSLLALDYPSNCYEIIVVDNGSSDDTCQRVKKYPVKLLEEREIRGPAAARNKGIMHARGDVIAFTDADCVADPSWLKMLVADYADITIGCLVGDIQGREPARTSVEVIMNRNRPYSPFRLQNSYNGQRTAVLKPPRAPIQPRTDLERLWVRLGIITYYQRRPPLPPLYFASTGNVAYRREVFEEIGLFDTGLRQANDMDFSWRLQLQTNYKIQPVPEAVIYHRHMSTLAEFFARQQRSGLGRILLLDRYVGLDFSIRCQTILEGLLNIIFDTPRILAVLGYRNIKSLVHRQPYPLYLYEPLVNLIGHLGYNYGRMKACLKVRGTPRQRFDSHPITERATNLTQTDKVEIC